MRHKMTLMLAVVLAMMVSMASYATTIVVRPNNPSVKVSADGTTLTFINESESGDYQVESEYAQAPAWCSTKVTKVVIDPSFDYITPGSTAYWFSGCTNLKTIEGIEYLHVDSVQRADYMFYNCRSLTTLDLSGFNTYKLISCQNMFAQCNKLKTIYGNTWNILDNMSTTERQKFLIWQMHHSEDNYMFDGCTSLVGGSGTTYNASIKNKDYTYCHVDGGTANPGFFTRKAATLAPYAVLNYGVLTLYYDNLRHERMGTKYDITFGEYPDYAGNKTIKEVDIDSSMSGLELTSTSRLFDSLYELATIRNIGNLNTSRVTDMSYMFYHCCSLGTVDLSGLNTQNVTDMSSMFLGCFALSYANLSGLNTAKVTNMANMFSRCLSLKTVNLNLLNTSKVTDMSGMFSECLSLQTLDLSSFNTKLVTTMQSMFQECRNLRMLNIRSFNTANVTNMSYMFNKCNSLQTISLDNFNTAKVTDMKYMFGQPMFEIITQPIPAPQWYSYYTQIKQNIQFPDFSVETIDISSFNTANVTNMTSMFEYQPALTTIYVGNSWSTAKVSSSNNMFMNSKELVGGSGTVYDANHVDYLYAHVDGGTSNPGYLTLKGTGGGTGVKEAYAVLSDDNTVLIFYYDTYKNERKGMSVGPFEYSNLSPTTSWYSHRSQITTVMFDSSFATCTSLTSTSYWFYFCTNLTTIIGIKNLKTNNVTDMRGMFSFCSNLTSLDVSGFKTDNVTDMSDMFSGCSSLTSLDVSGFKTDKVTNMSNMFKYAKNLTSLNLSSFKTDNVTNMSNMFNSCSGLTSLDLSSFRTENVTNMSNMFSLCSGLKSLDVSSFKTGNVTNMDYMFYRNSSLTSLDVSGFNTENVTNMGEMFSDCTGLKSLDLSNFKTGNVTNMKHMLSGCSGLTSLNLNSFETDKVTDMSDMFSGCSGLTYLNINSFKTDNVTDFNSMFSGCNGLTSLDLSSFKTDNVTNMYGMFQNCTSLTTIYVSNDWSTEKVGYGSYMFSNSKNLVGGKGTVYNSDHTDKEYARIDNPPTQPGYLTLKAPGQAYAVLNGNTLTFYYDKLKESRVGKKYDIAPTNAYFDPPAWYFDNAYITKAVIDPSMKDYIVKSTAYWFLYLKEMTTVEGLSNLNTSELSDMHGMFYRCTKLQKLDLKGLKTPKVTDMSYMFNECDALESLDLSGFNVSNVTNLEGMFTACTSLTHINLSSFNTIKANFMYGTFGLCTALTTLDLSSFNTSNVTDMSKMFYGCSALSTIFVGKEWSCNMVSNGEEMFENCTELVGGAGTAYNSNHTDHTYAHVDGGPSNPGYLTYKANWLKGDVNGDGEVGIGDIVAITNIMAGNTGYDDPTAGTSSSTIDSETMARADVNGDGEVGIGDIVAITNIMAGIE